MYNNCQLEGHVPGDRISFFSTVKCCSCGWIIKKLFINGTYAGHRPSSDGSGRVVDLIISDHRIMCPHCYNKDREIEVKCGVGGTFIQLNIRETFSMEVL